MGDGLSEVRRNYAHAPVAIGVRPDEWNLTTIAPPKGYNSLVPPIGFRDFYNLRSPVVPKEEETAEMRNLKAWKDAQFRMPFDALPQHKIPRFFNFDRAIYEFTMGFAFGSVFAVFWQGPPIIRFMRRARRGELKHWKTLPWKVKGYFYWRIIRRFSKIPMLFGMFQLLLRGINPIINGYAAPWILGSFLIGVNHMRRKKRRMRWEKWFNQYRPLGNIEALLEHRPLHEGAWWDKWSAWLRAWPRNIKRRIWRGMIIIGLIELMLLTYRHEGEVTGRNIYEAGFRGYGIMASPTFGADPPEQGARKTFFKLPDAPQPVVDGANYLTHWLWQNNRADSGNAYVPDRRMFSATDLKPILEPTPEQLIKFDPTALKVLDNTPAFLLGQQDWRSSNAPTGRHEPMVRVGALADGRYVLQRICLETLVQTMADIDPRWIDPSHVDIAADILNKAAEDERILGRIYNGEILTDPWEETPHKPLIVTDWNRRMEKHADHMIKARSWSWSNLPIWAHLERVWDAASPNPPTYKIEDGPGGYENMSAEMVAARRQYVLEIDPVAAPDDLEMGPAPVQFFKRLQWKHPRSGLPPGMPEGMPAENYVHMRTML